MREKKRVHDLVILFREDVVQRASELGLRFLRFVGAQAADDRVHGVIGAAGIDCQPANAAVEHPLRERPGRPRMANEVPGLVDFGFRGPVLRVVLVIAGVDEEDVAALDVVTGVPLPTLEVLGPVEVVVAEAHPLQVDNTGRSNQEIKRQVADELAARKEVGGRVEMGADVERHRHFLAAGLLERQPLYPLDRGPRVARESGGVHREVLRQVKELHCARS